MPLSQADRLIRIATPLEDDAFVVLSFTGIEEMSALFEFELALASGRSDITFDQLSGKNVTVSIRSSDNSERFFNGIIVAMRGGGDIFLLRARKRQTHLESQRQHHHRCQRPRQDQRRQDHSQRIDRKNR